MRFISGHYATILWLDIIIIAIAIVIAIIIGIVIAIAIIIVNGRSQWFPKYQLLNL